MICPHLAEYSFPASNLPRKTRTPRLSKVKSRSLFLPSYRHSSYRPKTGRKWPQCKPEADTVMLKQTVGTSPALGAVECYGAIYDSTNLPYPTVLHRSAPPAKFPYPSKYLPALGNASLALAFHYSVEQIVRRVRSASRGMSKNSYLEALAAPLPRGIVLKVPYGSSIV